MTAILQFLLSLMTLFWRSDPIIYLIDSLSEFAGGGENPVLLHALKLLLGWEP
jgi:hypothetical protein